jgi:hypothetical protein
MAVYEVSSSPEQTDALATSAPGQVRTPWRPWHRLTAWLATCADYHEAAALYEAFRGLSDAELARRGLDRATLGCDACRACDRSADHVDEG